MMMFCFKYRKAFKSVLRSEPIFKCLPDEECFCELES